MVAPMFVVFLLSFNFAFASKKAELLSDDFIAEINSKQSTWTAGRNFPEETSMEHLSKLCGGLGVHPDPNYKPRTVVHENINHDDLPETFDARTEWPQCESIKQIRNQGACGSCWAFSAVECMSDRVCIHSSGKIKFEFSPEDLMSCCETCGHGCQGGYMIQSFNYWDKEGLVSGGDAYTDKGCRPYSAEAFDHGQSPTCVKECQSNYNKSYNDDKIYGASAYHINNTIDQIQQEIFTNGPVQVMYHVYEDFYAYKSGVYQHTTGKSVGFHDVKIIGWGVENGVPYWLVANSWGADWGDEGGFFKILRGENHCSIESNVYAGIPALN